MLHTRLSTIKLREVMPKRPKNYSVQKERLREKKSSTTLTEEPWGKVQLQSSFNPLSPLISYIINIKSLNIYYTDSLIYKGGVTAWHQIMSQ